MTTTTTPLLPENWYHIYNRGIDGTPIFFEEWNYYYFLKPLAKYVLPVAEIYAYSPFHLLVRILESETYLWHLLGISGSITFFTPSHAFGHRYASETIGGIGVV